MAFVLGAIGLSIHRPSRSLTCSPLSAGGRVSYRLLKGPPCRVRCFGFTRLRILLAPSVASILTWPTHPTLPLLLSRALRRPSRQLFRWVWVSLSLAFERFFSFLVPRRPLSRAPAPIRPLPPSMASQPRLNDHSDTIRSREGTSDHRVTLPHGRRGYVGPPRHTAPPSPATRFREGMSDRRVTLPHGGRGYVGPPRHTAPPSSTICASSSLVVLQFMPTPTDVWPTNMRERCFTSTFPSSVRGYCARHVSST